MGAKASDKRSYSRKKPYKKDRRCLGPCGKNFVAKSKGERFCPACRATQNDRGEFAEHPKPPERLELSVFEVVLPSEEGVRQYVVAQDADDAVAIARPHFVAAKLATAGLYARSSLPCKNGMVSEISRHGLVVSDDGVVSERRHAWRGYRDAGDES
jgi:hypothetical protein